MARDGVSNSTDVLRLPIRAPLSIIRTLTVEAEGGMDVKGRSGKEDIFAVSPVEFYAED